MKKSNRFTDYDSDNTDREDLYWDQNLSQEDVEDRAEITNRKESKSSAKRKKARKSIRKIHEEDYMED